MADPTATTRTRPLTGSAIPPETSVASAPDADDVVYVGAKQIGAVIGEDARSVNHLISVGALPVFKLPPSQLCRMRRSRWLAHVAEREAAAKAAFAAAAERREGRRQGQQRRTPAQGTPPQAGEVEAAQAGGAGGRRQPCEPKPVNVPKAASPRRRPPFGTGNPGKPAER
jgi:hypothetical protein